MNKRENLISLLRRKGYGEVPVEFSLCPSLVEEYRKRTDSNLNYTDYFQMPWEEVDDLKPDYDPECFKRYYDYELKPGTYIDLWGIAHETGSEAAKHMTGMRHPLQKIREFEEILEYPFPDFKKADATHQKTAVDQIHAKGLAALGSMQMTVWETAWYIRSMEELMMDMLREDAKAEILLDKVMEQACIRAQAFAGAGGRSFISWGRYRNAEYGAYERGSLFNMDKARLKEVIDSARAAKPDIIVFYHSCGFIIPLIPHLIDAGVDVLNPVQPECMNFKDIYEQYGDRLSFHGTIGTQTTMPFGTPGEVRREVFKNLEIAGDKGGLLVAPTHLLEPEVPWENIMALVKACNDFK